MRRPSVVTFANKKGGVGKTATATNVAAALAMQGLNVLALDLDAQGDLTDTVGADVREGDPNLAEALDAVAAGRTLPDGLLLPTSVEGLSVIAGGIATEEVAGAIAAMGADGELLVGRIIDVLGDEGAEFDVVVCDTPPEANALTVGAVLAADLTVIVLSAVQPQSLKGSDRLRASVLAWESRMRPDAQLAVVVQAFDRRKRLAKELRELVEGDEEFPPVLGWIPFSKEVEETPLDGTPLVAARARRDTRPGWALRDLADAILATLPTTTEAV